MDAQDTNIPSMTLGDLENSDLVEHFADMVKWYHYDPMGAERPSTFDKDELEREILRRMHGKPRVSREALDRYEAMVCWNHYDPHGHPRPARQSEHELRRDILARMEK